MHFVVVELVRDLTEDGDKLGFLVEREVIINPPIDLCLSQS